LWYDPIRGAPAASRPTRGRAPARLSPRGSGGSLQNCCSSIHRMASRQRVIGVTALWSTRTFSGKPWSASRQTAGTGPLLMSSAGAAPSRGRPGMRPTDRLRSPSGALMTTSAWASTPRCCRRWPRHSAGAAPGPVARATSPAPATITSARARARRSAPKRRRPALPLRIYGKRGGHQHNRAAAPRLHHLLG
jgi:hypothetical protein